LHEGKKQLKLLPQREVRCNTSAAVCQGATQHVPSEPVCTACLYLGKQLFYILPQESGRLLARPGVS